MKIVDRARMHALLGRCRDLPDVPQPLFELLELMVACVDDRVSAQEAPTVPKRKVIPPLSPAQLDAIQSETRILEPSTDLGLDPKEFPKTAKPMVPK